METLDIPSSLLGFKTGFTLDFGNSVIKLIYVTDIGDDLVRLHFLTYQNEDLEQGLDFIKEKVGSSLIPGQEVVMIGQGVIVNADLIEKKLNIRLIIWADLCCYGDGLVFLVKNFPMHEIVSPVSKDVKEYAKQAGKGWAELLKQMSKFCQDKMIIPACLDNIDSIDLDFEKMEVTFPITFIVLGSATGIQQVHEDGRFQTLHFNPVSGRTLLGMGSMMTGSKSFSEILAAASTGDSKHMNHHFDNLAHNNYKIDVNLFSMSQCIGKNLEEFSHADRAAGAVSLITTSSAMYMFAWAKALKIDQLFIIGGLPGSSQLIREEIAKVFVWQSVSDHTGFHPKPLFVKLGGYVAALGALLANKTTNNNK